jgi:thiosulfate dehydrogenase
MQEQNLGVIITVQCFLHIQKNEGRSGQIEGISKRINDCFERSLNGSALNEEDKEMKAMIAYIEYIGKDVPKGEDANSSGFMI